jgi:hypothetical protein
MLISLSLLHLQLRETLRQRLQAEPWMIEAGHAAPGSAPGAATNGRVVFAHPALKSAGLGYTCPNPATTLLSHPELDFKTHMPVTVRFLGGL